jgi:hypothetical protein
MFSIITCVDRVFTLSKITFEININSVHDYNILQEKCIEHVLSTYNTDIIYDKYSIVSALRFVTFIPYVNKENINICIKTANNIEIYKLDIVMPDTSIIKCICTSSQSFSDVTQSINSKLKVNNDMIYIYNNNRLHPDTLIKDCNFVAFLHANHENKSHENVIETRFF